MNGMHGGGRPALLVNTRIRICIRCGSSRISISEESMRCKSCGAVYGRADMPPPRFRPGDTVRIVDADECGEGRSGGRDRVYTVEKVNQDSNGAMHYMLGSEGDPIMIDYEEGPESYLERVGRKWGQAQGPGGGPAGA